MGARRWIEPSLLFVIPFFLLSAVWGCGEAQGPGKTALRGDGRPNPFLVPQLPGPYLVGNTSLVFEDASRDLSCGQGKRRLVVEIWYPAAEEALSGPENHLTDFFLDQREEVIAILKALGELPEEGPLEDPPTGSYRDAPVHAEAGPMPVLVFSHGFQSNRFQNYTMANYLASHGYLVAAPDHTCNAKVAPLPEGVIQFSASNVFLSIFERMADVSFLIDVFTQRPPGMFQGRIDLEHIGFWGHSFGGITVTEQVKHDHRVSAMLQLASFGLPVPEVPEECTAASMYLWGRQDKIMAPYKGWHDAVIDQMPLPKYTLEVFDAGHFAFSDLCLISGKLAAHGDGCGWGTRIGTGEPFENPDHASMHKVLNAYATAFLGASFFGYPELTDFLATNHFPEMIDYTAMTQ